jgi:CRP/FNR family transcriptional regulator, polysaccharide utilization system transcription regulator
MKKQILIIEDNPEVRENVQEILELAGYHVQVAPNGKVGVEMAQQQVPDLILCDVMMPELDGYGVLRILSAEPRTASIPFVFLTAKSEKDDFRKGMGMGADDYIAKPFDDEELIHSIQLRIKKTEILNKAFERNEAGLNSFLQVARAKELESYISEQAKVLTFKKKQLIFSEGVYPSAVFFIHKGKIKTFKANEDGREYITGLHKDGDFIGYTDLFEDKKYTESAETLEDSELCVIPKAEFFALLDHNRDVSNKFIKLLANDLADREERLLKLAYNSVRKRVAQSLELLYDRYAANNPEPFSITISRDDLSSIVGASKETVIRTLTDFKEEKLVDIKGGKITILELDRIKKMRN